jgi:ribosomal-protein-alanine N-acetyltransferase
MVYRESDEDGVSTSALMRPSSRRMNSNLHPAYVVRGYRPGDWKEMYELDLVCFEPTFRFSQREMRRLAEERGAVTLLAEAGTELAGFCIVHRDGKWGYIVTLDVAPAWRRRGVAARLLADAEAQARQVGASGMGLHVHNGNSGAIRFYESMGYTRVGMAEGFYGRGIHALVYRKTWGSYS